ncbi:MAG: ATP-dependent DNA helicase DinG [Pseudomonadales bacterium]|nr:ATP-dependent DNA helicase DinG [Pseudomonadales bacterium]
MLTDDIKNTIQQAYSTFIASKKYNARKNQRIMIAEIAKVAANSTDVEDREEGSYSHVAVIEAGTGIGKTIGYMLSLLPIAQAFEKKIVVSTATIALQEQILYKDLPDLREHSGLDFTFALAKGRGRYLCTSKLINLLSSEGSHSQESLFQIDTPLTLDRFAIKRFEKFKNAYLNDEWDGDRDSWDGEIYEHEWRHVTSTHYECGGRRCQFIDSCPFFSARGAMQEADCIIVNHDLVLSDLALGGGVVLPAPSETIYVFDEGHHLHEKAINHFSHQVRLKNTEQWLQQFLLELPQCAQQLPWTKSSQSSLKGLADSATSCRELLVSTRPVWNQLLGKEERFRFPNGVISDELRALAKGFLSPVGKLVNTLDELLSTLNEMEDNQKTGSLQPFFEHWQLALGMAYRRLQGTHKLWSSYAYQDVKGNAPHARWLNKVEFQGEIDLQLNCSPILAHEVLLEYLWKNCFSAVLTSATLSTAGDFDRLRMQTGLNEQSVYCSLDSPFDYKNNATLIVPSQAAEPSNEADHLKGIVDYIHEDISVSEGSLVLFNSQRQMEEVYTHLSSVYQDITLVQGSCSKHLIVKKHKERIESGEEYYFRFGQFRRRYRLAG